MEENKLTFQQAMNRLETITNDLSGRQLDLEQAMALFKEGLTLSKQCESQLKAFENEMNQLMVSEGQNGPSEPAV